MKRRRLSPVALALAISAAPYLPAACAQATNHPPPLDTDFEGGRLGDAPLAVVGDTSAATDHSTPDTSTDAAPPPDAGTDGGTDAADAHDAGTDADVADAPADVVDAADAEDASGDG